MHSQLQEGWPDVWRCELVCLMTVWHQYLSHCTCPLKMYTLRWHKWAGQQKLCRHVLRQK